MPLYEFECEVCNSIDEVILPISSDVKNTTCPECGGTTKKIISKSTFQLIGQGWAKDGYIGKYDRFDDAMKCEF